MAGNIDLALSGGALQGASTGRAVQGAPAPDASIGGGGAGDILAALASGQISAEQLLALLAMLSGLGPGGLPGVGGPGPLPEGVGPAGPGGGAGQELSPEILASLGGGGGGGGLPF